MIRITIRFTFSRLVGILFLSIALSLVLTSAATAVNDSSASQEATLQSYMPVSPGRYYYLTNVSYTANQVLTACSAGYHTASFWEILDVSNLTYDFNNPAAHVKADSGYGPPSFWYGWVRTGQNSSNSNIAGMGNCNNWTSTSNSDYGVLVRLTNTWENPPGEIGPWDATAFTCATGGPVWCVGDFSAVYLPIIEKN